MNQACLVCPDMHDDLWTPAFVQKLTKENSFQLIKKKNLDVSVGGMPTGHQNFIFCHIQYSLDQGKSTSRSVN